MPLIAGRYRLGESLGEGGMGRVWHARDEVLERDVAVKEVLLPAGLIAHDRDQVHRRTLREARAAARLGHPNVVQVFDVLDVDGRAWIVMAYVPSRSLHEVLREDGALDPRRVARVGLDLLAALKAAHKAGVDHRDVKPANVLLADDGRVLLTDFGIATIEGDTLISSSDMLVGSPEFMSPERARHGTAGLASDLWSLGATLYAAVEGRSPFHRVNALATLTALAADEPDPPQQAGALEPLLTGLLRKDPAERLTAAEAEHLLRAAAVGAYGHALVPEREEATTTVGLEIPSPVRDDPAAAPPEASPAPSAPADVHPVPKQRHPPASPEPFVPTDEPEHSESVRSTPSVPEQRRPPSVSPASPAPSVLTDEAEQSESVRSEPHVPPTASPAPSVPMDEADLPPASAPPASLPPASSAGAGSAARRDRRWIVVAAGVAAVLVGGVIWAVSRSDTPEDRDTTRAGQPPASAATTPSAAPSTTVPSSAPPSSAAATSATPSPPAATGSDRPARPAGWTDYRDSTGFSVYVPQGWNRSKEGSIVYFRDSRTARVLGIDQTKKPRPDPVADWRGKADYRVAKGDFPSYREIGIDEVDYFRKAADWEFTFTRGGVRQHVNNRGVITSAKQAYGFYWQTRDADWSRYRDDLDLIFASFRPAT